MTGGRHTARGDVLAGGLLAVATTAAYLPGSGRTLDYDGAVTVGEFVATPSLLDPFREQVTYNNHVLFSFLEHVVHSATGSRSELVLRILPIACAALTVGILAAACTRRFGVVPGVLAGVFVAVNPTFVQSSREVRGYSLLTLCALVSSLLLLRLTANAGPPSRAAPLAYVLVLAAGLATHVYMVLVVLLHVGLVGVVGVPARQWVTWAGRWLAGVLLGGMAYGAVVDDMLAADPGRRFRRAFPAETAAALLGEHVAVVAVAASLLSAVAWTMRGRLRATAPVALALVVPFVAIWAVATPRHLYARFFVWAVPAVGAGIAAAVARHSWTALPLVVALALSFASLLPDWTDDPMATRAAAAHVDAVVAAGRTACTTALWGEPLVGYTERHRVIVRRDELNACDVFVRVTRSGEPAVRRNVETSFPFRLDLPARTPGAVYSREPLEPLPAAGAGRE